MAAWIQGTACSTQPFAVPAELRPSTLNATAVAIADEAGKTDTAQ